MYDQLEAENYYHIYNRGNNKEDLFVEAANYNFFLKKYATYCYPVLDTYAYCLLKNHFHLVARVRSQKEFETLLQKGNRIDRKTRDRLNKKDWSSSLVSQQLSHMFNGYTQAFNKKYNRTGALFQRPFQRKRIDADSYFCNVISYIHRNPQLHRFVEDFRSYPYSSYLIYVSGKNSRLNVRETLDWFGGRENFIASHEMELHKIIGEFVIE